MPVFTDVIRVCPTKAGLYCGLLGGNVSTDDEPSELEGDFCDEQAATNRRPAAANTIFTILIILFILKVTIMVLKNLNNRCTAHYGMV